MIQGLPKKFADLNLISLRDQRRLDAAELAGLRSIGSTIIDLVGQRSSLIAAKTVDPLFALPQANWLDERESNDFFDAYRHVATGDEEVLNNLRLYSQAFTGYQLLTFAKAKGLSSINDLPSKAEERDHFLRHIADCLQWAMKFDAIRRLVPSELVVTNTPVLGEVGIAVNGTIANHDSYAYQERLNILYFEGVIDFMRRLARQRDSLTILEIGGGYGFLAAQMKRLFPEATYLLCDLPESLLFSASWLTVSQSLHYDPIVVDLDAQAILDHQGQFILLPNYRFERLLTVIQGIDCAINTLSFSEMSRTQVEQYANGIKTMLGRTGILFEQNTDNLKQGQLNAKDVLSDVFEHRRGSTIRVYMPRLYHGIPHLWANVPLDMLLHRRFPTKRRFLYNLPHFNAEVVSAIIGRRSIDEWFLKRLG